SCAGVTCPPPGPCEKPGQCNPLNGYCSYPTLADGTPCDDGALCSQKGSGQCAAGECKGVVSKTCPALDSCHGNGLCDAATGRWGSYPDLCPSGASSPIVFGSPCNDATTKNGCMAAGGVCVSEGDTAVCCKTECKEPCHSCALAGSAGECVL